MPLPFPFCAPAQYRICIIFILFVCDSSTSAQVETRLFVASSDRGSGPVHHHSHHRCTLLQAIFPRGEAVRRTG